ncbi:hypothetical protein R3P38DRAFT_2792247 [Favolaschia claudopus]|uniref:Uncharacterized protein n=1 Tax=Favolaschia claudopus TaxID=2862362 RepID=A0AAW0AGJ9_9AGAR
MSTFLLLGFMALAGGNIAPLPNNTLAYVVAKASAPVGQPVELDAFQVSVVPGNPNNNWLMQCSKLDKLRPTLTQDAINCPTCRNVSMPLNIKWTLPENGLEKAEASGT